MISGANFDILKIHTKCNNFAIYDHNKIREYNNAWRATIQLEWNSTKCLELNLDYDLKKNTHHKMFDQNKWNTYAQNVQLKAWRVITAKKTQWKFPPPQLNTTVPKTIRSSRKI
jgi:hypothetical protein